MVSGVCGRNCDQDMIKNFVMNAHNRPNLIDKINRIDCSAQLWTVNIRPYKSRRSNDQNKWLRGFAKDFGEYIGYSPDESYELIMYKFCPEFITEPETKAEIRLPGHFSKHQDGTPRNTAEAAQIQERVLQWGMDLGFMWSENEQ